MNFLLGLITAINIALKPNPLTYEEAIRVNGQIKDRENFIFDATHFPHVTVLQIYVQTKDLEKIDQLVDKVSKNYKLEDFALTAPVVKQHPLTTTPGLNFVSVKYTPTAELKKFQHELMTELLPYKVTNNLAEAFYRDENEIIDQWTIDYVESYFVQNAGENYQPHLTLGITREDYITKYANQPPPLQAFTPSAVSIYHVGNFGTARKELSRAKI